MFSTSCRVHCRLVLVTLIAISSRSALAWQLTFPQDTVAYNDKFNNRQSMAFDSQGRIHIAYNGQVGTTAATSEIYYVSLSGDSLITMQVTSNAVDDHYPTICVDRNDNVHIGFEVRDAGNLFQVVYTRLLNGVFTPPVFITQGGLNKATPYCAIGPDSVVHFVYHTFPPTGTQYAYYRRYDLRDSTLSTEQQLTNAGVTGDFDAAVATDTAGYVHIVVKSGSASGGPLKYYTNRTGTLVETPTGVVGNIDYPRVLIDRRNVVHILYRNTSALTLNVVNNSSGSFGPPLQVTPAGQRPAGYHNFAVDDEGRLYIVYQSSSSSSGRGFYLVHGKDGVFADTMLVYNLSPDYVTRNTSAIAARNDGQVAVTYSPGGVRGGSVICDIFLKRGNLHTVDVREGMSLPAWFVLHQNYPNPFNPTTQIRFSVAGAGPATVEMFDILGQKVKTLFNENAEPGRYYDLRVDGTNLASGVYFYRLKSGTRLDTRKMLLLK
jgi:hypothetical protein